MDYTASFYSRPSYVGSGAIFSGARRQRGGSILGALKSLVLPVMAAVGPKLIRSVGNIAKKQVFGLATDLLADKVRGRNMTNSLKTHGRTRLLQGASDGLNSIGNMMNVGSTRRARRVPPRRRRFGRIFGSGITKRKTRQTTSRKRKASRKSATPAKRRRVNF